jgi:cytochrome c peroxidase
MIGAAVVALLAAFPGEGRLPEPPLGIDLFMPIPERNPLTPESVALGQRLFFDKRLSSDESVSCATCHDSGRAFSDGRALAIGLSGAHGPRNSPAIINRGYGRAFFWDGRASSLEEQVLQPITNPKELGLADVLALEARAGVSAKVVSVALASYVRSIRAGGSRFDRYMAGDSAALIGVEQAGLALFRGKANCAACHVGPNFTDELFHNTGIAWSR